MNISPYVFPGLSKHILNKILINDKTINVIVKKVSKYFGVSIDKLKCPLKNREYVIPRHICMYVLRKKTTLSVTYISNYFGGREHTAAIHATKSIENIMTYDDILRKQVYDLMK
jgi:chromosomal replication initiator protein